MSIPPPSIPTSLRPFPFCHCPLPLLSLRPFPFLSLRAQRGNPGGVLSLRPFPFCPCGPFPSVIAALPLSVIASAARQSRGDSQFHPPDCFGTPCLAMTRSGCHCERSVAIPGGTLIAPLPFLSLRPLPFCHCERDAAIPHNSSYKSRHPWFIPLIKSIFFCLEPALICFSLKMAFSISSNTS